MNGTKYMEEVGIVIIGRNEGERLRVCLRAVCGGRSATRRVVYVDSGSTDDSVMAARGAGAEVIELRPPYTAARGRNAGLARLVEIAPEAKFVQFIDGDVELAPGWIDAAKAVLSGRGDAAVVCGRLRERDPERSIYNRLCDAEWDRPIGETRACGGIAMMRIEAVRKQGGFREDLISGEEPELCLRLHRDGWKVLSIADEMGWHDAAMERFGQWWRRTVRAGHGFAQGAWLQGGGRERYCVRPLVSVGLWGAAIPAMALIGAPMTKGLSLLLLAAYPVQWARVAAKERSRGHSWRDARLTASFMLLGKLAQVQGVLQFAMSIARRKTPSLIEYKGTGGGRNHPAAGIMAGETR
jgi:GT2 family glycosyltransferase